MLPVSNHHRPNKMLHVRGKNLITIENAGFQYEGGETESLRQVTLHVAQGECVALCGASGCGKTTLLRLVNGLVPHFYPGALTGRVTAGGLRVEQEEPHALLGTVGSVFQNPRTQFFSTDSTGEIVFGMENAGLPREEMHRRLDETVASLSLQTLLDRDIFALSGGEKQRIAFGGVYALSPRVYVLDEPTANLDNRAADRLREALLHIKNLGKTILVAEHRLSYLNGIADRFVFLEEGRLTRQWTAAEFAALSETDLALFGLRPLLETQPPPEQAKTGTHGTPAVEFRNVSAGYRSKAVLQGLEFCAAPSEIVGITGANGNGKTTFARTLCGLHKESVGEILFEGKAVPAKKRSRFAYLVMQDPNYQLFSDSVEGELRLCSAGNSPAQEDIDEILDALGLQGLRQRHPLSLSGGQKQRLAVALAALSPAKVLVFDEPTSGLDLNSMRRVAEMLQMLAQRGKTILVITHDTQLLSMGCHRIFHLQNRETGITESEENTCKQVSGKTRFG